MTKGKKNIAASVHQLLLNEAKKTSRTFNEVLQHYAIERFIYRLSKSHHSKRFVLKGALMFYVWCGPASRPTMDLDLLGKIDNNIESIIAVIKDAMEVDVEPDGILFNPETITATRITEDVEYEGVRVRLQGNLGNARVSLQIDIGFGDVIVPGPSKVKYPVLLDFPSPELYGYSMESVIAEKFEAMTKRGILNSRMKDFYDIWMLSRMFNFKGTVLADAIRMTFQNRNTVLSINQAVFDPEFINDPTKNTQWQAFIRKSKIKEALNSFHEVSKEIQIFIKPIIDSLIEGKAFQGTWDAPGPWQKLKEA